VAHTDDEHLAIDELHAAVELYQRLARRLLA
jgi:acetylornithine deacetylase/succinyl-diaminopimelate desuccinylase-like protein